MGVHHPTKQVPSQAQVPLDALELCNAGKYPIFHVAFTYDPMTRTDAFFVPFYNAMFSANGHNPLAFVDRASNEIVYVSPLLGEPKVNGRILIDVSYEGLSSIEPNDAGDEELDGSQEVPRGLLVAGGDRTKLLDLGEEVLDQMARRI